MSVRMMPRGTRAAALDDRWASAPSHSTVKLQVHCPSSAESKSKQGHTLHQSVSQAEQLNCKLSICHGIVRRALKYGPIMCQCLV